MGSPGTDYGTTIRVPFSRPLFFFAISVASSFTCHLLSFNITLEIISLVSSLYYFYQLIRFLLIIYGFSYRGGRVLDQIHIHLMKYLNWNGVGKLLDVGCGSGRLAIRCAKTFPEAYIIGMDNFDPAFKYTLKMCENNAQKEGVSARCEFVHGDATKIDFEDETFDVVVCNLVYHDIHSEKDKSKLLLETLRVLKKGGIFVIQDYFNIEKLFGAPENLRILLKERGFSEIHYEGDLSKEHFTPWYVMYPHFNKLMGVLYGKK